MLKNLAIVVLIIFIPLVISAEELNESESFLAAKAAYDNSSYSVSLDLFNKFINSFPASPAVPEAKLYIAQCFFYDNKFIEARDILNDLEKTYVPFSIEDKFLFLSGQIYLRARDFKEATRYFKKLIENHPDSALLVSTKMQMGWALFQDGKYPESEKMFDSLTKSENLDIQQEALFKKGEVLFFAKDYAKSIEEYNTFIKLFPNSDKLATVYFYMAEASFYLEDFQYATGYYSKALQLAKEDESIKIISLQGLGWSYLKQNKLSKAEDAFLKVEKSAKSDFNKENFLFGMANLYYQLGKFDKSAAYYDELLNRYPQGELFFEALFGKAQCLTNLLRSQEAINLYDIIIEKGSDSADSDTKDLIDKSYYNLGCVYFTDADLKKALFNFKKMLYLSEDKELRRSALSYSADIYQQFKNFDKAIETYLKILKDYPDSPHNDYVLYQLGISRLKAGDRESAISSFRGFNDKFNDSEYLDDVNYYLGYAYFINNDFAAASGQLEKFLEAFPDSVYIDRAVYLLADSFYNRKMFKEAIDNFEKVVADFKHNESLVEKAEYFIAYALYEQDKEIEAIAKIRQFIDRHPNSKLRKQLMFWLGQYYYENSLYELSRNNFEAAISSYPGDKKLAEQAKYEISLSYLAENNTDGALGIFGSLSEETRDVLLKMKVALAMADLLYQQDKREEAVKMYNEVVNLAPRGPALKEENETEVEIDSLLDYTEREKQLPGLAFLSKTKVKDSDSIVKIAYIRLGDLHKGDGDFDGAIYAYRQAIKYATEESTAYLQFKIGECFEEKNDLDTSIDEYLKIPYLSELDKFWAVKGLLRCANIYENREDWQDASMMYERVLTYNTAEAKYAQERIDSIKTDSR